MSAEFVRALLLSALVSSAAMASVLCLRRPLRVCFGARVAYGLWLLVPVATAAAWLPTPVVVTFVAVMADGNSAPAATSPVTVSPLETARWLGFVWLLGAAGALLSAIHRQRRFVRSLGQLMQLGPNVWRAQAANCGPVLVGALRPRIVVPRDFEQRYDPAQRTLVLAHERLHRVRGDTQVNALVALGCCVYWFNPLVYFAASRLRFDQELACDAIVIARAPRARRRYAEAMLNTQLADLGLPAGCHWQSCHPLKERIAMLKQNLPGRLRMLCGVTATAVLVAAGSVAAWAVQPATIVSRSAGAAKIRGDIALRIDGGAEHRLTILTPPGVEFAVADGADAERWEVRGSATPRDDGTIALDASVRHNDAVVATPRLIANDGISAGLHVEDPAGAARLDASFVLTRSDATALRRSVPATENTTFRRMKPPTYPLAAVDAHQTGKLVLRVHVDDQGNPQTAQVEEAQPAQAAGVFADNSIAAAMQWRYIPGTIDGKPAAGDVAVPIEFNLIDD